MLLSEGTSIDTYRTLVSQRGSPLGDKPGWAWVGIPGRIHYWMGTLWLCGYEPDEPSQPRFLGPLLVKNLNVACLACRAQRREILAREKELALVQAEEEPS
jgi:hypothetical protein